jgi:hypothetical protein
MARAPLSDVFLHSRLRGRINTLGTCYVYHPGTTTEASVYIDSSSATTITQPLTFNVSRDALPGWVNAGEYDLSAGGKTQPVEVTAGDAQLAPLPSDDGLSVYNACPQECIPSVSATTTDGTIKFVRIVPDKKITAAQVVLVSGTAVA